MLLIIFEACLVKCFGHIGHIFANYVYFLSQANYQWKRFENIKSFYFYWKHICWFNWKYSNRLKECAIWRAVVDIARQHWVRNDLRYTQHRFQSKCFQVQHMTRSGQKPALFKVLFSIFFSHLLYRVHFFTVGTHKGCSESILW